MRMIVMSAAMGLAMVMAGPLAGGDLEVQSFDQGGLLTFSEIPQAAAYRIEWAPAPEGPWTNCWNDLASIEATGSGTVTRQVPMCYRVLAILSNGGPLTLAAWDFENEDRMAGGGLPANLGNLISREDTYTGSYSFSAGADSDKSLSTTRWADETPAPYYLLEFSSAGCRDLTLSSKQRSSDTGPRDFRVQWRVGGGEWADVPEAHVTVANNFTSGILADVPLPADCDNQAVVALRWIRTGDSSVSGGQISQVGTSRIDDIIIRGREM